jgi:hypothetical protein
MIFYGWKIRDGILYIECDSKTNMSIPSEIGYRRSLWVANAPQAALQTAVAARGMETNVLLDM